MNSWQALQASYSKRFDFYSRSRRSEYWWVQLACFLLIVLAELLDSLVLGFSYEDKYSPLVIAVELVLFIPVAALTARRLHDVGITGWAQLPLFLVYGSYIPGFEGFPFNLEGKGMLGFAFFIVAAIYCFGLFMHLIQDSQPEPNRYGPSPKDEGVAEVFD